jgi:hypothetical protein
MTDSRVAPIVNSLDTIIGAIKKGSNPGEVKLGSVLEVALAEWLKVRFSVAAKYHLDYSQTQPPTLRRLLGLDVTDNIKKLPSDFHLPLWTPSGDIHEYAEHNMKHLCRTQQAEFLAELEGVEVTPDKPVAIIQSATWEGINEEDPWDVCVKALLPGSGRDKDKPFYVFLDCKSATETRGANEAPLVLPDSGKQFRAAVRQFGDSIDFAFVYITTHKGVSFKEGDCIVMRKEESRRLLGPVWPLYRVARNYVEVLNPQNREEPESIKSLPLEIEDDD